MVRKRGSPKIFFGWWTVFAAGILNLWGFSYTSYGFSALFKPIALELGFSRATTSIAPSISRVEGGLEGPLTGWLTDKFGPRWVVIVGVFIMGLGLILMKYIDSLWAFYVVWGVIIGTGNNVGMSLPLDTAISNWFVKKRGLAISTKWVLSGLSGVLGLPLIAWLITVVGWRQTCFIGGVVMWLVGLPLAWFFLRQHRPEYYGLLPDGATAQEKETDVSQTIERGVRYAAEVEEVEFTLRQAVRAPTYWILLLAQATQSLAMPAVNIHGIPFLTDMGITPVKAAAIIAIFALVSIPTRFFGGFLADRVKKGQMRLLVVGAYLLQTASFVFVLLNQSLPMIYAWLILYGFAFGASLTIYPVMRARYFGRKAFGSIAGVSMLIMTPVGIIAPVYAGWVYDTTGSYLSAFTIIAILLGVATLLMFFATPPKPPARITDVRQVV